jgi:hypothetical protein
VSAAKIQESDEDDRDLEQLILSQDFKDTILGAVEIKNQIIDK